ncbi:SAF domain-containing protein [Aquipuribacter sp. SD81]|uniref:SAF domain-containing protein n=1 Tax=Aquipuribacter sp. SD81 TaxID=3127703 RepID=UPI0030182F26
MSAPRTRRRPGLLALGIALVVVSALGAVSLFTVFSDTQRVVLVVAPVDAGQTIGAEDLAVTDATVGPDLAVVPAGELDAVVGAVARVPLLAGQLLSPEAVLDGPPVPGDGAAVVGLPLTRTQMPAGGLQAGDRILVVDTPQAGGEPPTGVPDAIPATVLRVVTDPDDPTIAVVDVVAPVDDARSLGARGATGRIAVVLEASVSLDQEG